MEGMTNRSLSSVTMIREEDGRVASRIVKLLKVLSVV